MSGEDVATAVSELEGAIYECLQRSRNIKRDDLRPILNLLSGKLRATSDSIGEGINPDATPYFLLSKEDQQEVNYG